MGDNQPVRGYTEIQYRRNGCHEIYQQFIFRFPPGGTDEFV